MSTPLVLSARQLAARAAAAAAASLADLAIGPEPSRLLIYTAPRRAAIEDPVGAAVLLCDVALTDPPGTVSGASLTLTQAADAMVLATGDPAWAVLVDGNGVACADMSAGPASTTPAADPDLVISQSTLFAGGFVRLAPLLIAG